jgi:glucose-fructose oxidoreductase
MSSYDYEPIIRVQTCRQPAGKDIPVDRLRSPYENPIQYFIDCLRRDRLPEGPLSQTVSRIGQQMVDSAVLSARLKSTVKWVG